MRSAEAIAVSLTRREGWSESLTEYIAGAQGSAFQYGTRDCCLFAADWIEIATGVDHAAGLRGYRTMRAAYRIVNDFGSIEAMVTRLLGREMIHASAAQRGDVVLVREHPLLNGAPECLAICLGLRSAIPADEGLILVPTLEGAGAWRI